MINFQYRFLINTDLEHLLSILNEANNYSYLPVKYSMDEFKKIILSNGVDLSLSIGAYDKKKLVSFVLIGKRNNQLHQVLTTTLPEYDKNSQLLIKMYQYAIPLFKSFDLKTLTTEIAENNEALSKIYRRIGFKRWRNVLSLQGNFLSKKETVPTLEFKPMSYYEFLIHYTEKDVRPTWQSSEVAIENCERKLVILKALQNDELVGYIIFDSNDKRLLQIFVKKTMRRQGIGTAMMKYVLQNGEHFKITPVDLQFFAIINFFKSFGAKEQAEQIELIHYL